ncbi:MAG: universal stress protein [Desulfobulbus sp.]|nr:MAG: universal stress protein [Desulfobulbus sp.]RUM40705.1 MAG: universal stress protein [Desulfobulbus sp.]
MGNFIMVGIDDSDPSKRAAQFAAELARSLDAKLLVVYVIQWTPFTFNTPEENESRHKRREEEVEAARSKILTPILDDLLKAGTKVEGFVRHGRPAKLLNYIVAEKEISQIVIGRTGAGGLKNIMFGSVASKMVQTSSVPITVVP